MRAIGPGVPDELAQPADDALLIQYDSRYDFEAPSERAYRGQLVADGHVVWESGPLAAEYLAREAAEERFVEAMRNLFGTPLNHGPGCAS